MKKLVVIALAIAVAALAACASLDVVGKDAVRAFGELPYTGGSGEIKIAVDESASLGMTYADGNKGGSISMFIDAAPFIAAGLSREYIDANVVSGNIIAFSITYDTSAKASATPADALADFMKTHRSDIGYHTALDHYNIDFGGGNMFEWAKDLSANDKDIVFALNPEPFIAAGVDPNAIDGWVYAKVPMDNGEVDKLLKAYDYLTEY
jgi:hypothetical protein